MGEHLADGGEEVFGFGLMLFGEAQKELQFVKALEVGELFGALLTHDPELMLAPNGGNK